MRALSRRRILAGALGCAALTGDVTRVAPARADLWGGDLPLLAGILVQAVLEVTNLASMLTQIINEVQMMTTMLKAVESGSSTAQLSSAWTTAMRGRGTPSPPATSHRR